MKTIEDRFWSKVDIKGEDDCWNWKRNGFRYGSFIIGNKTHRAHRIAWKLFNKKEIPEGFYVLHRCDNTLCVNPKHLYLGSARENAIDVSKHGNRKRSELTETIVREIKKSKGTGTRKERAEKFGLSFYVIQDIDSGKSWKWVK